MPDCEIFNADSGCDLVVDYSIGDTRKDRKQDNCDPLHGKVPSKQNALIHAARTKDAGPHERLKAVLACNRSFCRILKFVLVLSAAVLVIVIDLSIHYSPRLVVTRWSSTMISEFD